MEDLIGVAYENQYSALEQLYNLRALELDWIVDLHDAVAVARDSEGKLHIQESYKPTSREGAGWGALLGIVLGGLALTPFTAGLSAAAAAGALAAGAVGGAALGGVAGAAAADKDHHGLSEEFVSDVSSSIKRGQSAIFALVERYDASDRDRERAADYFRGTGGKIIRTNLSPYEQERVRQILAGNY